MFYTSLHLIVCVCAPWWHYDGVGLQTETRFIIVLQLVGGKYQMIAELPEDCITYSLSAFDAFLEV